VYVSSLPPSSVIGFLIVYGKKKEERNAVTPIGVLAGGGSGERCARGRAVRGANRELGTCCEQFFDVIEHAEHGFDIEFVPPFVVFVGMHGRAANRTLI